MVDLLVTSSSRTERAYLAVALTNLGGSDVADALLARIPNAHGLWIWEATFVIGRIAENTQATDIKARLVASLATLSETSDMEQRKAAIVGLGWCSHQIAVPALVSAIGCNEDEKVRQMAVNSLAQQQDERVWGVLVALLHDRHPSVRETAASSLGGVHGREHAEKSLILALDSGETRLQEAAAASLGLMGCYQAVGRLVSLLDHSDPRLRAQAAVSLGRIGVRNAVPALARRLGVEEDTTARFTLVHALGKIGTADAIAALQRIAREDSGKLGEAARSYTPGRD